MRVLAGRSFRSGNSSQTSCQPRTGFTLLEMLIVIVIIGILSSALVVSVQSGYKQARQAACKSNLRQFGVALTIYRGEHDNRTPPWISRLYPDYIDDRGMFVCRADKKQGTGEPRPDALLSQPNIGRNEIDNQKQFWDNKNNLDSARELAIECCSYLYEFSYARPPWRVNIQRETMCDYKMDQMTFGYTKKGRQMPPYSASRIPIVRCYHHWRDQKVYGYANATSTRPTKEFLTINVAYAGNVFVGPLYWEGTIHPGESEQ